MNKKIRIRFAPSPTGNLHIGGARTALFNFLFARHNQGTFILRIEDTDKERSTQEYLNSILDSLKWLELNWDEGPEIGGEYGPYNQIARLDIYSQYIKKLLETKNAYICNCSPERLEQIKTQAQLQKQPPKYDGKCRNANISSLEKGSVIRFKIPQEGITKFNDLIRKEVSFENKLLDDFIIQRSDGTPIYNFTVVIDDLTMEISHVIRGEDHISNTPKQILLYKALGINPPQFAHLPLIFGKDKTRLSKRHGATSVIEYQKQGFLKEALINYLSLLGWSYDDKQEFFTIQELIKNFSLERVSKNPAIFDLEKLYWINGNYIRNLDIDKLTELCLPYLKEAYNLQKEDIKQKYNWIKKIVKLNQDRLKYLAEIVELTNFFFQKKLQYDEKAVEKILLKENPKEILNKVIEKIENLQEFTIENLENVIKQLAEELNINASKIIHPVRVSCTGQSKGPGLFELMAILEKETVLERIKNTITTYC
ncbi:MAG: glutamate--tRNA ligase [bacterium]